MASELNMFQAQVKEYKFEIEKLNKELQDVKKKYFEQKRGGTNTPSRSATATTLPVSLLFVCAKEFLVCIFFFKKTPPLFF